MRLKQVNAVLISAWLALGLGSAQASDVVRIGVLTDMAGPLSDAQGMGSVEAAKIAVEEFGGKVLGKKIEVLHADHQNKADIGVTTAKRWIDTADVGMILDLGNSAVAIGVQSLVEKNKAISIATGAASGELTNKYCNPHAFQWGYDTYQFAKGSTGAMVKAGGDSWFFITADYAFGHALEADSKKTVEALGGKVLGAVRHPINTMDFSSYLLQAKASGAKVIAVASAVGDLQNVLKQGSEFQIFTDKQKASAMAMLLVDVHSVGLKAAQGTTLSSIYYWDANDGSREFAKKFSARMGRPPSETHAMNYSATLHYLKSMAAANTLETEAVIAKMRATPVNDLFTSNATVRADGRLMRDIFLVRVKSPEESSKPWDYFKVLGDIKADDAFRPVSESVCPLLKP